MERFIISSYRKVLFLENIKGWEAKHEAITLALSGDCSSPKIDQIADEKEVISDIFATLTSEIILNLNELERDFFVMLSIFKSALLTKLSKMKAFDVIFTIFYKGIILKRLCKGVEEGFLSFVSKIRSHARFSTYEKIFKNILETVVSILNIALFGSLLEENVEEKLELNEKLEEAKKKLEEAINTKIESAVFSWEDVEYSFIDNQLSLEEKTITVDLDTIAALNTTLADFSSIISGLPFKLDSLAFRNLKIDKELKKSFKLVISTKYLADHKVLRKFGDIIKQTDTIKLEKCSCCNLILPSNFISVDYRQGAIFKQLEDKYVIARQKTLLKPFLNKELFNENIETLAEFKKIISSLKEEGEGTLSLVEEIEKRFALETDEVKIEEFVEECTKTLVLKLEHKQHQESVKALISRISTVSTQLMGQISNTNAHLDSSIRSVCEMRNSVTIIDKNRKSKLKHEELSLATLEYNNITLKTLEFKVETKILVASCILLQKPAFPWMVIKIEENIAFILESATEKVDFSHYYRLLENGDKFTCLEVPNVGKINLWNFHSYLIARIAEH